MTPDQIKVRTHALYTYIENFVDQVGTNEGVKLIVDCNKAAENICALYDRYAEDVVRPTIDSGIIQNFKIVGNTELAVMRVAPIIFEADEKQQRLLNARLAFYVCLSFLTDWNNLDATKVLKIINEDAEIRDFVREHTTWLYLLDARYFYPLFSNSQVWRLFYILLRDRINSL